MTDEPTEANDAVADLSNVESEHDAVLDDESPEVAALLASVEEIVDGASVPDSDADGPLAEYVAKQFEGRFCWNAVDGWRAYIPTTGVWRRVSNSKVLEASRLVLKELFLVQYKVNPEKWGDSAYRMQSLKKSKDVAQFVQGMLEVDPARFDANAWELCVGNGIVDLRTGDLREHDARGYMTRSTGTDLPPDGTTHEDLEKVLSAITSEERAFLQERFGQGATGEPPPDDRVTFMQGDGSNAKTTVMFAVRGALGDYYTPISDKVLLADPNQHRTYLMRLRGARFVVQEELPDATRLVIENIKRMTEGEIQANYMRQDEVSFPVTHSMFVLTNPKPLVKETDWGSWRRLQMMEWKVTFIEKAEGVRLGQHQRWADTNLRRRVIEDKAVHEAMLRFIVDGAVRFWQAKRVFSEPPASVRASTRGWRERNDVVLSVLKELMVFCDDCAAPSLDLLHAVNDQLRLHGHPAWSDKTLTARLEAHDAIKGKASKVQWQKAERPRNLHRYGPAESDTPVLASKPVLWVGMTFRTDGMEITYNWGDITAEQIDAARAPDEASK